MSEVLIAQSQGPQPRGFLSLDKASFDLAVQGAAQFRKKRVQLTGRATTPIIFKADTKAFFVATNPGPYNLFSVGSGATIKATPDAGSEATITLTATAGKHTSGVSPATDISAETDNAFKIALDGDSYHTVTIDPTSLTTGNDIAAELQTKIQALGGIYATATAAFSGGKYVITSPRLGSGSKVRIAPADAFSISEELKIGPEAGGVDSDGTGNVSDLLAVTVAELIAAGMTGITLSDEAGALKLESATSGYGSKLVIGSGTANAVLGLTGAAEDYGIQGMGYDSDMTSDDYVVSALLREAASLVDKALSVNNPTVSGFDLICEDTSATDYVDVIVQ